MSLSMSYYYIGVHYIIYGLRVVCSLVKSKIARPDVVGRKEACYYIIINNKYLARHVDIERNGCIIDVVKRFVNNKHVIVY